MKILTGEIGKLSINGKQVGGFRNWRVVIDRDTRKTDIYTTSYWMLEKPDTNMTASFYAELNKRLKIVKEGEVILNLPDNYPLGTNIKTPLKMSFKEGTSWLD